MFEKDENYDTLATEVRGYLTRFAYFPSEAAADIATLWAMSTHATGTDGELVFASHPRIAILSTGPGSGKSRVLELLESISKNAKRCNDPSAPGILSLIEQKTTVMIDECDQLFQARGSGQKAIKSILNSGYRPGSSVMRLGKEFSTYAPVALAGMKANFLSNESLRPLVTRSLIIDMVTKPKDSTIDPWRERLHGPIAAQLSEAISYWAKRNVNFLATCWPTLPEDCVDRNADLWEPLIAVGEAIGPIWQAKAFKACEQYVSQAAPEESRPLSPTETLLRELANIFNEKDSLPTATILEALGDSSSYWRNFPSLRASAMELSSLLKPMGVAPVKLWDADEGRALQGYKRESFGELLPTSDPSDFRPEDEEDANLLPL